MRVSSRADYGVRALFDLAERAGRGPVQSREIAVRQGIPEAYLQQLLGALNRAGFVRSTRGPAGGHELAREPAAISLWDVLIALDGQERGASLAGPADGDGSGGVVQDAWRGLHDLALAYLREITLATLLERDRAAARTHDYAI